MKNIFLILLVIGCSYKDPKGSRKRSKSPGQVQKKTSKKPEQKINLKPLPLDQSESSFESKTPKMPHHQFFQKKNHPVKLSFFRKDSPTYQENLTPFQGQTYLHLLKQDKLIQIAQNFDLNNFTYLVPKERLKSIALRSEVKFDDININSARIEFSFDQSLDHIKDRKIEFRYEDFSFLDSSFNEIQGEVNLNDKIKKKIMTKILTKNDILASPNILDHSLYIGLKDAQLKHQDRSFEFNQVYARLREKTFTLIYSSPSQEKVLYLPTSMSLDFLSTSLFKDFNLYECHKVKNINSFSSIKGKWHTNLNQYIDCKNDSFSIKKGGILYFVFEGNQIKDQNRKLISLEKHFLKRDYKGASERLDLDSHLNLQNYLILNFQSFYHQFKSFHHLHVPKLGCEIFTHKKRKPAQRKQNLYTADQMLQEIKFASNHNYSPLKKAVIKKKRVKIFGREKFVLQLKNLKNFQLYLPFKENYYSKNQNHCTEQKSRKYAKTAEKVLYTAMGTHVAKQNKIYPKMELETKVNIHHLQFR